MLFIEIGLMFFVLVGVADAVTEFVEVREDAVGEHLGAKVSDGSCL